MLFSSCKPATIAWSHMQLLRQREPWWLPDELIIRMYSTPCLYASVRTFYYTAPLAWSMIAKSTNLFVLILLQASLQLSVGLLCLPLDSSDLCFQVSPLVDECHQPTNHTATGMAIGGVHHSLLTTYVHIHITDRARLKINTTTCNWLHKFKTHSQTCDEEHAS